MKKEPIPVYLFSPYQADLKMIADLGDRLTQHFTGTIANIKRAGDFIEFTESIKDFPIPIEHTIWADSIVVVVAPIEVQQQWLNAGVAALLIPFIDRVVDSTGKVEFQYRELRRIHKIEVVTSLWVGNLKTKDDIRIERSRYKN